VLSHPRLAGTKPALLHPVAGMSIQGLLLPASCSLSTPLSLRSKAPSAVPEPSAERASVAAAGYPNWIRSNTSIYPIPLNCDPPFSACRSRTAKKKINLPAILQSAFARLRGLPELPPGTRADIRGVSICGVLVRSFPCRSAPLQSRHPFGSGPPLPGTCNCVQVSEQSKFSVVWKKEFSLLRFLESLHSNVLAHSAKDSYHRTAQIKCPQASGCQVQLSGAFLGLSRGSIPEPRERSEQP